MLLELVFPVRLGGSGLEFFMKPSKAMYKSLVEIIVYQHCCLVPLTKWEQMETVFALKLLLILSRARASQYLASYLFQVNLKSV